MADGVITGEKLAGAFVGMFSSVGALSVHPNTTTRSDIHNHLILFI